MLAPVVEQVRLVTGMRMDRDEFMRVWEQLPDIKKAELIDGVVYVASPVSLDHGTPDKWIGGWLTLYEGSTPGVRGAANSTCHMLESTAQPDQTLWINSSQAVKAGKYLEGAPDLIAEVCVSSTEVDFGPKLALYQRAGVREYITIETLLKRIVWRVLVDGSYMLLQPDSDGVFRSPAFPGLWLDSKAFWRGDLAGVLSTLNAGLATAEHSEFVEHLRQA